MARAPSPAREARALPRKDERLDNGLSFRKFGFLEQQGFYIGENETGIEGAGTVDVPNAAFAVDEKDAENVEERTLRIGRVGPFVYGLAVGG